MHKRIAILGLVGCIVAAAVWGYLAYQGGKSVLTSEITRSAAYSVYEPANSDDIWQIDAATVELSKDTSVLTYTLRTESNRIVLSQQASPQAFTDIPGYYPKLLDKLHQYDEVSTRLGTVTLTRPDELKGGQSAVLNTSKGTLMFAHPDKDLSSGQWKEFFDSLALAD